MKEKLLAILDINKLNVTYVLYTIFIANLIDAYLTLKWINIGIATEANPIMDYLLDMGGGWFVIGKVFAISIACFILWNLRNFKSAKIVALLACLLYISIIIFHIIGANAINYSLF